MKILLTGGGTGGHIIPILAVSSELEKICAERKIAKPELMLITTASGFSENVSNAGISVKIIKAGKLRRYFSLENLVDIFKIPVGIIQSLYYINQFKPNVVFSKGGFASVPPVVAARILKIPILTHESDIIPGLANKIISFFADEIFVSFSDTQKYFPGKKVLLAGNIVRENILEGDKERAKRVFDLKENLPTVLIFGGSQGAKKINEVVLKSLPVILEKYQVIHICGMKNHEEIKNALGEKELSSEASELSSFLSHLANERYKIYPYLGEEMKDAYALADVVVARAGANSLSEIIVLEKPSVIIPLSYSAGNHQLKNAEFFARKEMLIMIEEKDLAKKIFIEKLFSLAPGGKDKEKIVNNIKLYNSSFVKDAVKTIAEKILSYNTKSQ